MHFGNKNKGSVTFVFYFIIALALLAVAGYYIGLNEQKKLFKSISDSKQQQNDVNNIFNTESEVGDLNLSNNQDVSIKSLIDSPSVVLRNLETGSGGNIKQGSSTYAGTLNIASGVNVVVSSEDFLTVFSNAKQSEYLIKTNEDKDGTKVRLVNGEAKGDNCYNAATERVCFPYYKLEKIWSIGDLNADGVPDAIVSVLKQENVLAKKMPTNNFYALVSNSSTTKKVVENELLSTTSTSTYSNYSVVSFEYGVNTPTILSAEISEGTSVLIGNFYASGDISGKPTLNKVVRYKFELNKAEGVMSESLYSIKKIGEATLFKEQKENTSIWYAYNYEIDGLNFSFKTPESWQREENFDKDIKIVFKETDGRNLVLETRKIIETCSEYNFNLKDDSKVKINNSEFIDLGEFGVGLYIKYAISINDSSKQYHADICVTDKNNDKKVFSLYSTTKEDDVPYFSMFDKIWSTFKIRQE